MPVEPGWPAMINSLAVAPLMLSVLLLKLAVPAPSWPITARAAPVAAETAIDEPPLTLSVPSPDA